MSIQSGKFVRLIRNAISSDADKALEESYSYEEMFTCWRYRDVSATEFMEDVREMLKLFGGDVLIVIVKDSPMRFGGVLTGIRRASLRR